MSKFKVKTTAVIDNNPVGSIIELSKESAEKLSSKNYVIIIEEIKPKKAPAKKAKSAPKKPATKTAKKKTESKK